MVSFHVQLAVLVGGASCSVRHFTYDDAVQFGLLTPPLVVEDSSEGLLGGVPAVGCQGEGAATELGVGLSTKPSLKRFYVEHRRVQDSAEEQTLDGVVQSRNNAWVAVAIDSFNAFDELVDTRCGNLVFPSRVTLDLLGCLECIDVNGGAVVEDSPEVQALTSAVILPSTSLAEARGSSWGRAHLRP